MTAIEHRISEGLHAYGEGLDMTAQDIDRLEDELELRRQAPRRQRQGSLWQGVVAACAVSGVVLGALALGDDLRGETPPAAPPSLTPAQLEGIWRVSGSDWLWRFSPEGTLTQSNTPDLLAGVGSTSASTARPTPGGFILEDAGDPPGCFGIWAATISAEGRMRATEAGHSDACPEGTDPSPLGTWELTRVSPVSVAGAATMPDRAPSDPRSATYPALLSGTWLLRGTGTLLTVNASADYALHDLGAADEPETGRVDARSDGVVTFTPDDGSGCSAVYRSAVLTNTSMDTHLADSSCNRLAGTSDTWIRLN